MLRIRKKCTSCFSFFSEKKRKTTLVGSPEPTDRFFFFVYKNSFLSDGFRLYLQQRAHSSARTLHPFPFSLWTASPSDCRRTWNVRDQSTNQNQDDLRLIWSWRGTFRSEYKKSATTVDRQFFKILVGSKCTIFLASRVAFGLWLRITIPEIGMDSPQFEKVGKHLYFIVLSLPLARFFFFLSRV